MIDEIATRIVQVPLNYMTSDFSQPEEEETSEKTRPIDTNNDLNHDEIDFLLNDVNEIVKLDGSDLLIEG